MGAQIKVHLIREQNQGQMTTVCGRQGSQCRGYAPKLGDPGEYDTAICDRIHATPHTQDVTCRRCQPVSPNGFDEDHSTIYGENYGGRSVKRSHRAEGRNYVD